MNKELLQQARDALAYHTAQTRPIEGTDTAIAALDAALAQPVQPIQPADDAQGLSDLEAKQLLAHSDLFDMFRHIGWYSAPESGFMKHGLALIKQIEAAINAKAQPVQPAPQQPKEKK